jgi:hypothetical protein
LGASFHSSSFPTFHFPILPSFQYSNTQAPSVSSVASCEEKISEPFVNFALFVVKELFQFCVERSPNNGRDFKEKGKPKMFRSLLGFDIDFWDYVTFVTIMILVVAGVVVYCWLAGLPGRIAIARKHPEAEAVKLLGWAGLLPTIYPWVQAFIWAFKPTDIVDIRRFPREEQKGIEEEIARLSGKTEPEPDKSKQG